MKSENRFPSPINPIVAFATFLHRHGCLEAFMTNAKRTLSVTEFHRFLNSLSKFSPCFYVTGAFLWDCTPEGAFFWGRVDDAWAKYRSKHHIL